MGTPCNRMPSGEDRSAGAATNRDNNEAAGECHVIAPPKVPTLPGSRPPPKCALLQPGRYIGYAPPWAQRAWQTRPGDTLGMVRAVFASRCCGYAVRPSAEALARALHPDAPQTPTIGEPAVRAWLTEATREEIVEAWLQGAYPIHTLVAALHTHPVRREDMDLVATLNTRQRPLRGE